MVLEREFLDVGRKRILNIPLIFIQRKDRFYWAHSSDGNYNVKASYTIAMNNNGERSRNSERVKGSSENRETSKVWKKLWDLNIKQKLKNFIWKCLHQVLPVGEVIWRRIGKGNGMCRRCGENMKTVEHCLFMCKDGEEVWKIAAPQWDGLADHRNNFWR
ncbi:hypothetical protein ACH5RR_013019 [Cinchona calisaya]|uniref:Reverse transcriptase zinc-binding domain-containing protein n=1 Tax=Cinchona calisaya TaxID=153742 RepID=A0ABD3A1I4_9GENT